MLLPSTLDVEGRCSLPAWLPLVCTLQALPKVSSVKDTPVERCDCKSQGSCVSIHAQGSVFWAVNGVGLSLVIPNGQSLIADYYEDLDRGKAFGALYLTGAVGAMIGALYATNIGAAPRLHVCCLLPCVDTADLHRQDMSCAKPASGRQPLIVTNAPQPDILAECYTL